VVTELRRAIRRRVASRAGLVPLPSAQLELLRLVRDREGLRVQEASTLLRIAPNSVSTLVKQLEGAGLLARWADPRDGRATRLRLTAAARGRMAHWRDERQSVIAAAFSTLSPSDRRAIDAALGPLRRMAAAIEAEHA
jgi:DNA-binding MarR family transcriptional regulator